MMNQEKIKTQQEESSNTQQTNKTLNESLQEQEETTQENNLDPTYFGDWQIGCKTIDF